MRSIACACLRSYQKLRLFVLSKRALVQEGTFIGLSLVSSPIKLLVKLEEDVES